MTPTPAQVEACRVACWDSTPNIRWCWARMHQEEKIAHARMWLAGLAYRAGKPPATNQEVDALY